jgi:hypothetical protein
MLWDVPYIIEILTPRRRGKESPPASTELERFERRYRRAAEAGCAVSIPDNPLGNTRFSALETFDALGIRPDPDKTLVNLNTFHGKDELDRLLDRAAAWGLRYLLVILGDGSPALSKLQPAELGLGVKVKMVTSIELLGYINERYGDAFCTGAAFNQYKPDSVERRKLERKREAGARFIVTQPVLGRDTRVERIVGESLPVIVEAWMSTKIELFMKSVKGRVEADLSRYDPAENLAELHRSYDGCSVYLSLLDFNAEWGRLLPGLG